MVRPRKDKIVGRKIHSYDNFDDDLEKLNEEFYERMIRDFQMKNAIFDEEERWDIYAYWWEDDENGTDHFFG